MAAKRAPTKPEVKGFTDEEKAAMRDHAREVRRRAAGGDKSDGESDVLAKIATMAPADRALATRVHALVKAAAPELTSRTWYGMPAYSKDGEIVCHFQESGKFKMRYSTLGFTDEAKMDDGRMWPVAYAITELTPAEEERIKALVKRAVG